jgi:hypothetical protein
VTIPRSNLDVCSVDPATIAGILREQRELLSQPGRWTRGTLARNLLNEAVVPLSDRALRWGLVGSIAPVLFELLGPAGGATDWQKLYDHTVAALWEALPSDHPRTTRMVSDLDGYNDFIGTGHDDVLDLIDRALKLLES